MKGTRCLVAKVMIAMMCSLTAFTPATAASPLKPWGGGPAPELSLKDLDGRSHDLAGYRGKVVLINFWATWCEPCRQEMPSIERLKDKLAGKRFVSLAVNVDEPEARIRQFLNAMPLALPVLLDPNKSATRAWGVRVLPATFIVGPDGRVRYRLVGDMDWSNDTIVGLISQLMGGG